MKVLQLGKFYPIRGGVEKVMWDLTEGLAGRGIPCDMLCAMLPTDDVDPEHRSMLRETSEARVLELGGEGRVICVPAWKKVAATMIAPKMVSWMKRHAAGYDIVHIHHPDPMAALALRLSGYKGRVILHWHSDILSRKVLLWLYKPLQRWLIRRADRIVGTTPVYIKESADLRRVQDKTTWIPIGIKPVPPAAETAREIRDRYPGKKIVFALGRLVPYKGFRCLVYAGVTLPDDYVILIGGDGPLKKDLSQAIKNLGLQEKVSLLGYIRPEDIPRYYNACDVFVMCSRWKTEAFGIVQIEAMSCGKPVVATMIPQSGVSWVNKDGVSGLNVLPNDPEALAGAILRICADPAAYRQYAAAALERYNELFTFEKMIENTINIYEKNN